MRERPILFSAPMVRALLAGTKTQTRRIVKPQPTPATWDEVRRTLDAPIADARNLYPDCPYGQPGDRLWVRECVYYDYGGKLPKTKPEDFDENALYYRANGECCEQIPECCCAEVGKPRWTPSIHMPRWASRITLEITGVRVERLQGINTDDMEAEGVYTVWHPTDDEIDARKNKGRFAEIWESINGPGSWNANPWVWVVEFKRVMP